MISPIPPSVSERETIIHRLAVPSARIFAATVILVTGTGISAIFWKMPQADGLYALYHDNVVDQDLAMVPLPTGAAAVMSPEEIQQIMLPVPDIAPVTSDGAGKYGQVYPAPAPLAMVHIEQGRITPEEEELFTPVAPQKFEPMREIIDAKPFSMEPVNRDFAPMPTSVSTTERSDELHTTFHFVEHGTVERDEPPEPPVDLFPIRSADVVPFPVVATPSALQPLPPLQLEGGSPLLPLRAIDLQSFSTSVVQ